MLVILSIWAPGWIYHNSDERVKYSPSALASSCTVIGSAFGGSRVTGSAGENCFDPDILIPFSRKDGWGLQRSLYGFSGETR